MGVSLQPRKNKKNTHIMNTRRKYFKTRQEALKERKERAYHYNDCTLRIFKMPKGTRHHGQYFIGTEIEYLNFAN